MMAAPAFLASGSLSFSESTRSRDFTLPDSILEINLPSTHLARDAAHIMFEAAPRTVFNHCLRTFVLGMMDAQRRGLDVDVDVVFHASILHDLCLTPTYPGNPDRTFEENSAEFAAAFARAAGLSDRRAENVYQAILLHAGRARDRGPDIEFVMHGARQDVVGPRPEELSDSQVQAVEREVPRLDFKVKFLSVLKNHAARTNQPGWTSSFAQNPPLEFLNNRWSS